MCAARQTSPNLITGCALIVARSFARIHETNLKVSVKSSPDPIDLHSKREK